MPTKKVAIVSLCSGNIASLEQAFEAIDVTAYLASTPDQLLSADALVLPGVGHFGSACQSLTASGLREPLTQLILSGMPCLGICLGFHLLTQSSEEAPGEVGLGFFDLFTVRITPADPHRYKVPHLGWNTLSSSLEPPSLLDAIHPDNQLFYFANSYAVVPTPGFIYPHAFYNHNSPWLALVQRGSICGVQFHPEKSRSQGLQLLRNFLRDASC